MTNNIQKAFKTKSKLRGMADGGKVRGKGGPTDDKVGPVALSDGEYVLPADTVDIVGRDKLDALRLATHDFVDEDNKPKVSRLRKMANGGIVVEELTDPSSRRAFHQARAAVQAGNQFGANTLLRDVPRPAVTPPPAAAAPAPAPAPAPTPATETPRPQAGATSKLGNAVRAGGALLATGLEAKNVYDAYQSGGVDAAVPEAAMGATRLTSARLGAAAGAALPLPGWGKPVAAAVGGVAGYMAPDAVANSEYMQEKGRESALRGAFSSRLDKDFAPTFDPRANTITTSDGRMFGSGRLDSDPHLQYQGYLSAKTDQAIDSKAPLFNPTAAEMDAIGVLKPRERNVDVVVNPTVADLDKAGALRPAVSMNSAMGALRFGDAPGGGFAQTNVPGIFGRKSGDPNKHLGEYIGVGTPAPQEDPIMGEIRSALRGLTDGAGSRGGGGGASIGSGNASEINKRYDDMLRDGAGRNRVRGLDWSQRHGLDVERARASELDADARNRSALRGQDMQASTAANSANMQARMQALQTLGTMANQRSTQSAQAQAAQLKALQDAQTAARQGEEKGFERYNGAISSMFVGPDGKPDAAEQERFTSFLQGSDPKVAGLNSWNEFTSLPPQQQSKLLQDFKVQYDAQKAQNARATAGVFNAGATTNRADLPVDVREATWNDVWNNHLPVSDYLYSNLPFTNPNVVVSESGQPTLVSDYATTDGNWDSDKLNLIERRTGKDRNGRSALRGGQ